MQVYAAKELKLVQSLSDITSPQLSVKVEPL
jgi:hypothetical protein